jgi:hypothetical protein
MENSMETENFKKYYEDTYDHEFYYFDQYQYKIDPEETLDDINAYTIEKQKEEIEKCVESFTYFCHKYIKILHPTKGLIPFLLFKYQARTIDYYNSHRFNIISKFRQGGLTTVTLLWGLWKCMFQLDQQIMTLSKTDREAVGTGMIIDRAVEHMPLWIKPSKEGKWNDHLKQFPETGGSLQFYSPEAARGKAVTFLIIDEAAFIPDMEKHWKAMWPVLSTGGSCVLVSTVNGLGNWYAETYNKAKEGKNMFHVIDLDYWEHPEYSEKKHPNWVKEQHQQLGEKGFMQEVMRSFLGSGETYFPSTVIVELDKQTSDFKPIKKLFPNFSNKDVSSEEKDDEFSRGALWIWKEPVEGHEYIIGVDPAEGIGSDGDNSCIQIISATTNEQVAEFYSNLITPHDLAQIINELGLYYNNALVAVEDMSSGGIILNALQNSPLMYENLYISTKNNRNNRPGIKITVNNRSMMLQEMQSRVINFSLKIRSKRLVREINTFEYNPQTKKAEAVKGKHDDAIMALAIANYVRDEMYKDIPVGFDNGESLSQMNMVSDLRKQLREGLESHVSNIYENNKIEKNEADAFISLHRKNDSLLREFGW